MKRWYVSENEFLPKPFARAVTPVYVPEHSDVEAVAQGLYERDRTIDCEIHYCDGQHCMPPWHRAHVLDRNEYLEKAQETLRILGVLG